MHRLALYLRAVQNPRATAALLQRVHQRLNLGAPPATLLREDFSGTAAIAAAWVERSTDHRALAIDFHAPTVRWALKHAEQTLGDAAADLHLLCADVLDVAPPRHPRVDVVAALNFSALIYHDHTSLLSYLRHARRCLRKGGVLVLDTFGGPKMLGTQSRRVAASDGGPAFDYEWEQRGFNPVTGRIDCRIHFTLPATRDLARRTIRSAFRYDWRLWSPADLLDALREAGFKRPQVWADTGRDVAPVKSLPADRDFVAYLVGRA